MTIYTYLVQQKRVSNSEQRPFHLPLLCANFSCLPLICVLRRPFPDECNLKYTKLVDLRFTNVSQVRTLLMCFVCNLVVYFTLGKAFFLMSM
jgi:hypothetical protein